MYQVKRSDLLGGIVSVLTGGKVRRVSMEKGAPTGRAEFKGNECRRIVLPDEASLPEGFTLDSARGLLDHEMAHAIWTTNAPGGPANGTLHFQITNILEDARIEVLMGQRFPGAKANIAELNRVGMDLLVSRTTDEMDPLTSALVGIMLMSQGVDPAGMLSGRTNSRGLLALLAKAKPHVAAGITAKSTSGAATAAKAILDLLTTPPPPMPSASGGDDTPEDGEGEQSKGGKSKSRKEPKASKDDAAPEGRDSAEPEDEKEAESKETEHGEAGRSEDGDDEDAKASAGSDPDNSEDEGEGSGCEAQAQAEGPPDEGQGESSRTPEGSAVDGSDLSRQTSSEGNDLDREDRAFLEGLADEAAKGDPSGHVIAIADAVAEALKESLDEAEKEVAEKEARDLLEAQRTGLLDPIYPVQPHIRALDQERIIPATEELRAGFRATVETLRPTIMGLRSALRIHLLSEGRSSMRQEQEQGTLSTKTLYQVAQKSGSRVFQTSRHGKTKRTLITLLVDGSGSMTGPKTIAARDTAIALAEALRGLPGLKTEILGFRTEGGGCTEDGRLDRLEHTVLKAFTATDASPAMTIHASGANADGESLRWAGRRLLAQRGDRRILIVLSDGQPSFGFKGDELRMVDGDLRAAVDAVERAGIETLGIGIMDRSVTAFYPKNVVINAPADLVGGTLRQLATLLMPPRRDQARALAAKAV